jgi:hypothetical protein
MGQQSYRATFTVAVEVEFSGVDPAARAAMLLGVLGRRVADIRMPGVVFSLAELVDVDIVGAADVGSAADVAGVVGTPAVAAVSSRQRAPRWGPRWSPAAAGAI